MRRVLALGFLVVLSAGIWFGYRLVWGKPLSIHHFADRVGLLHLRSQPELLTYAGFLDNTLLDFHSQRLSDLSPQAMQARADEVQANYRLLQEYRDDALDRQETLTLEFMDWWLGSAVAATRFPYHFAMNGGPYPVNPIAGAQFAPLRLLDDAQRIVDLKSSRRYLERMAAIGQYVDSLIEAVRFRDALSANAPQVIIRKSLAQIDALTDTAPAEWSIHSTLVQSAAALGLEEAERRRLSERSLQLLEESVIPAYRRLATALRETLPRAPEDVGVWMLPEGAAYYRALLYLRASTRREPDEIHALGLRLVALYRDELIAALDSLGYTRGGIVQRIHDMMAEPGERYADSEAGRVRILADFRRIGGEIEEATASAFNRQPDVPVEVVRVPEYAEDGAAGASYLAPSLDGIRPGRFRVNLRAPGEIERHGMPTLSAHEAVPGHHFERSLTQSLTDLPMFRRNMSMASYTEGWALYAEQLVYELGVHDTRSNIGRLQSMLFRAARLVVDTGIHARRWSREKAIAYLRENTGMPLSEVRSEIDRYIANPAQACAYMLGMQSILSSREAARARLGDRFELAVFHDAVLANGPLPIAVLERQLEDTLR